MLSISENSPIPARCFLYLPGRVFVEVVELDMSLAQAYALSLTSREHLERARSPKLVPFPDPTIKLEPIVPDRQITKICIKVTYQTVWYCIRIDFRARVAQNVTNVDDILKRIRVLEERFLDLTRDLEIDNKRTSMLNL